MIALYLINCGFTEITSREQTCRSTRTLYPESEPTNHCSYSLMLRAQQRRDKCQFYSLFQPHRCSHPLSTTLEASIADSIQTLESKLYKLCLGRDKNVFNFRRKLKRIVFNGVSVKLKNVLINLTIRLRVHVFFIPLTPEQYNVS